MPMFIIKLTDPETAMDYYLEWSTVVDAPVTHGMSLETFKAYHHRKYGAEGQFDERMARVRKKGTSSFDFTLDELLSSNRAGPKEGNLSPRGIFKKYCSVKTRNDRE